MEQAFTRIFDNWNSGGAFSGVFSVSGPNAGGGPDTGGRPQSVIFQRACGYRNRAERLPNEVDTSFAIASGTKLFTALCVCKWL